MSKEPVLISGAVVVLANSIIALLVLLDVFTPDVGAAVGLVITNAVAVVGAYFARSQVSPVPVNNL